MLNDLYECPHCKHVCDVDSMFADSLAPLDEHGNVLYSEEEWNKL